MLLFLFGAESRAAEPRRVLMLHALADKTAPHLIRILEVYASRAAYEAHIATPHFLKYKSSTSNMVRSLRLIDMDPIILATR